MESRLANSGCCCFAVVSILLVEDMLPRFVFPHLILGSAEFGDVKTPNFCANKQQPIQSSDPSINKYLAHTQLLTSSWCRFFFKWDPSGNTKTFEQITAGGIEQIMAARPYGIEVRRHGIGWPLTIIVVVIAHRLWHLLPFGPIILCSLFPHTGGH
jgi:hypothetical protein